MRSRARYAALRTHFAAPLRVLYTPPLMPSERVQRRTDALLEEADEAADASGWWLVADAARAAVASCESSGDALRSGASSRWPSRAASASRQDMLRA